MSPLDLALLLAAVWVPPLREPVITRISTRLATTRRNHR